VYVKRYICIHI